MADVEARPEYAPELIKRIKQAIYNAGVSRGVKDFYDDDAEAMAIAALNAMSMHLALSTPLAIEQTKQALEFSADHALTPSLDQRYLYIGTARGARDFACTYGIPENMVTPSSLGEQPWRGVRVPPVIVNMGEPVESLGARNARNMALEAVAIIEQTSGIARRRWTESNR